MTLIGVPRESYGGERRVALTPTAIPALKKSKLDIIVESGAGVAAGYADKAYEAAGARIGSREEVFAADVLLQVRALGANPDGFASDLAMMRGGQIVIATMDPLSEPAAVSRAAQAGVTAFALELVPRITRAQSMDVLSSQANLAGYKAVLLAAGALSKIFPMLTTAAGTIVPARVFVIGAGVAGLQAIATARRLGGVVSRYDVRPAVKVQVESLGARFVSLDLDAADAQDAGGYAKAQSADFYARQAEKMGEVIAASDVVITTASIPGQKAPTLITADMVERMAPGSVIVDLAAERGGNCALTRPGETVDHGGVLVLGPLNLPSEVSFHASQLFGKNVATFLLNLVDKEGALAINREDEIVKGSLLTGGGVVVHPAVLERLSPREGASA